METSRVTSKGQTTIPKPIRDRCGIGQGDLLSFTVEGDRIVVRKVSREDRDYLHGVEATLSEWLSPEDEDAFRDL